MERAVKPEEAPAAKPAKRARGAVKLEPETRRGEALVGAAVVKRFGGSDFAGRVVSFDAETRWYFIHYEDGDKEELNVAQVLRILVTEAVPAPAAAVARAAAGASRGVKGEADEAAPVKRVTESAPAAAAPAVAAPAVAAKTRGKAAATAAATAAGGASSRLDRRLADRRLRAEAAEAAAPAIAAKKAAAAAKRAAAPVLPAPVWQEAERKKRKARAIKTASRPDVDAAAEALRSKVYLPLRTPGATRWRTGTALGGLASLAGEWRVYAAYHTVPHNFAKFHAIFIAEALVASSGTLVLTATAGDQLTGVMTDFIIGSVFEGDIFGPVVDHGDLDVRAEESGSPWLIEKGAPKGAFPAVVTGFSEDRWVDESSSIIARLDMRSGEDELVPRLRETYIFDDSDSDSDSDDMDLYDKEKVVYGDEPPFLLRAGDLRLEVRWGARGRHGDPGIAIAYLMRRAASEAPATLAEVVSAPCEPVQSWADYDKFRRRIPLS